MEWVEGAKQGIVVAGDQGEGNGLTRLSCPEGVVVDQLGTVYVADRGNHRIMRWPRGATKGSVIVGGNARFYDVRPPSYRLLDITMAVITLQGIVMAGDQGDGNGLTQLSNLEGVVVDQLRTLDYCKKHKHAKLSTEYNFSELAEALFESAHYRDYVEYDKTKVLRPIATSLSANLSDK
ncbi:unnamed protein product, partial [Didymodactylos carnosus]